MNIVLSGASGRMGQMVCSVARESGVPILFGVDRAPVMNDKIDIYPSFGECPKPDNDSVLIDFSLPGAIGDLLDFALRFDLPCVLAATGYSEDQLALIRKASEKIPILQSGNMSMGVCAVRLAAGILAKFLSGYDIEIVEKHHNQKKDAPSGTAVALYDAVKTSGSSMIVDRAGLNSPRQKGQIGISSVRGGTVTGEHEIGFYGSDETVLITHRAQSRRIFAVGALRAAAFIMKQPSGLYGMDDLAQALTAQE